MLQCNSGQPTKGRIGNGHHTTEYQHAVLMHDLMGTKPDSFGYKGIALMVLEPVAGPFE